MSAMRTDANAIRSVVLDGPYPTTVGFNDSLNVRPTAAFEQLFADCAADVACGAAFPDLRSRVIGMIERLNDSPVAAGGFTFTGDFALIAAARALYQYTPGEFLAPEVPRALSLAADGDFSALAVLAAANFAPDPTSTGTHGGDATSGSDARCSATTSCRSSTGTAPGSSPPCTRSVPHRDVSTATLNSTSARSSEPDRQTLHFVIRSSARSRP